MSLPRGKSLRVVADELQLSVTKTEGGDNTIARNLTLTLLGTDRRAASEASWKARDTNDVSWLKRLLASSTAEPTAEASPWEVAIEVVASGVGLAETTVEPLKTSIEVFVQAYPTLSILTSSSPCIACRLALTSTLAPRDRQTPTRSTT